MERKTCVNKFLFLNEATGEVTYIEENDYNSNFLKSFPKQSANQLQSFNLQKFRFLQISKSSIHNSGFQL